MGKSFEGAVKMNYAEIFSLFTILDAIAVVLIIANSDDSKKLKRRMQKTHNWKSPED
jgi:hypothetical protein